MTMTSAVSNTNKNFDFTTTPINVYLLLTEHEVKEEV
jgi:hypothetical protein